MSADTTSELFGFEQPEEIDIRLQEYESSDPLDLSDRAIRMIKSEVNDDAERIELSFDRQGRAILQATQYVGILSLPDGPTLQIQPKASQTNLFKLLQYAQGVRSETIEQETPIAAGRTFIEALAALFEAELDSVIRQGLHRDYRRVEQVKNELRGRLDVQKQIQRQGATPTQFECSYDELTYDTIPNQAALFAGTLLTRFVRDQTLEQSLQGHCHRLRQRVTLKPVRPVELDGIELTRLNDHYSDLIRLTKLILRSIYVREFTSGGQSSFAILIDMNQIFEQAVERAVNEVINSYDDWSVSAQTTTRNLVSDGKHSISIRPDILVRDENRTPILVGDAKWKLGRPPNSDFYQIVSYQFAHDVPGVLIYPEQHDEITSQYDVVDRYSLSVIELPTPRRTEPFAEYTERIHDEIESELSDLIEKMEEMKS